MYIHLYMYTNLLQVRKKRESIRLSILRNTLCRTYTLLLYTSLFFANITTPFWHFILFYISCYPFLTFYASNFLHFIHAFVHIYDRNTPCSKYSSVNTTAKKISKDFLKKIASQVRSFSKNTKISQNNTSCIFLKNIHAPDFLRKSFVFFERDRTCEALRSHGNLWRGWLRLKNLMGSCKVITA